MITKAKKKLLKIYLVRSFDSTKALQVERMK